ncbi:MAG: Ig-like domain-containing protein [Bacteroidales bacterium]|nr:Ig-like domain-containing protein [Bacteroidales bacterium]
MKTKSAILVCLAMFFAFAGCSKGGGGGNSITPEPNKKVPVTSISIAPVKIALGVGFTAQITLTVIPSDATDQSAAWTSSNPAVATVSNTGQVKAVGLGTASVSVSCGGKTASCQVTVDNVADLGLTVKWAHCNLGATTPEGYGDYYAWGEIETKAEYTWENYKWANGDYNKITKYGFKESYGVVDNLTTLELADDVANVKLHGNWRMPTKDEMKDLVEKCKWDWLSFNGVRGYLVTSKINGNSIFLPAAGYHIGPVLEAAGSIGEYWSSSLGDEWSDSSFSVFFQPSNFATWLSLGTTYRCCGYPIRPVTK